MKQSCNVIKDLLILYEDDACSEDSRKVVEEHLSDCAECNNYFRKLKCTDEVIEEELKEELAKDNQAMKKGLKKIRRRWILSLAAVLLLIPIIGLGIMWYHEETGNGVAFSNLDDIHRCMQYMKYIENKEFEKAADMVEFQGDMREKFINKLQEYDELGIYIDNIRYDSSYRIGNKWNICIAVDENYPDGSEQKLAFYLYGNSLDMNSMRLPVRGKIHLDYYMDDILRQSIKDASLEYKDYEVAFELKEGEKAIIKLENWEDDKISKDRIGLYNVTYGTGGIFLEPYSQDTFETSVPGKYSLKAYPAQGEDVYLTMDDIDIEIVKYE